MPTIHIKPKIGDGFGEPVAELFRIMKQVERYKNEEVVIDFQHCQFLHPFLILSLFALQKKLVDDGYAVVFKTDLLSAEVLSYLHTVYFHGGFLPESFQKDGVIDVEQYKVALSTYESRRYIPVISFPARKIAEQTPIRDKFLSVLGEILRKQINAQGQMQSALMYLLDESVNNIADHADTDRGYVFAQFYPAKGYMDICMIDTGISILGTYQKTKKRETNDHTEAIQFALDGISTKDEVTGRGYGIRTSRNMLVNGLGGHYLLVSGNAGFYHGAGSENIFSLDDDINWQGVIVYMRIPVVPKQGFDIYQYLERG